MKKTIANHAVTIEKDKCELCGKKQPTTRRLILGPRGFRLHETCDGCYTTYQETGKTPFSPKPTGQCHAA